MTDVKGQVYILLKEKDMTIQELMVAIYPEKKGAELQSKRSTIQKAVSRLIKWDKVQNTGSKVCEDGFERAVFGVAR